MLKKSFENLEKNIKLILLRYLPTSTNAGIIINPPPILTSPESTPTAKPSEKWELML